MIMRDMLNEEHAVSQRLIEAALIGDEVAVCQALTDELADVNHKGPVHLRVKHTDSIQREETADEVTVEYQKFKTDVTPLFAASHAGHINITRKLLSAGADVNEKLFRGYATTAAAREGNHEVLHLLQRFGASYLALEDALIEACLYGQVQCAALLIASEMIRPEILVQALVHASNRGLVDVVAVLIENGVDINSWHRMLLRSARPALHANVNCTPLVAAIVGRQTPVVTYLLQAGAKTGSKVSIGAWSWESESCEEIRVGAGLADPYNELWCAVEYWEAEGSILRILLNHFSPNDRHNGRTILSHAIRCRNTSAVKMLLEAGADVEHENDYTALRPIHVAANYGYTCILKALIAHGCDLNSRTRSGVTAVMLSAKNGLSEDFRELVVAGADLGLVSSTDGQDALTLAEINGKGLFIRDVVWSLIRSSQKLSSSDVRVFSPLHFVVKDGDAKLVERIVRQNGIDVNGKDKRGYSAAMVAAENGHSDALKVLIDAGSEIGLKGLKGESLLSVAKKLDEVEKIVLDAVVGNKVMKGDNFRALHYAAWRGDVQMVRKVLGKYGVNEYDEDEYTPLMLAAKEGHAEVCKVLMNAGGDCGMVNRRSESAMTVAKGSSAKGVLMDEVAMRMVVNGGEVSKHTREGRGSPHVKKEMKMVKCGGMLTWGSTSRRNVICKEASIGGSEVFVKNRMRWKDDVAKRSDDVFRIVTSNGREIHFESKNAEMWVRGINVVIKEAVKLNAAAVVPLEDQT